MSEVSVFFFQQSWNMLFSYLFWFALNQKFTGYLKSHQNTEIVMLFACLSLCCFWIAVRMAA